MIYEDIKEFANIIPQMGALAGIDYGQARIGLATSDALHTIATAQETYHRRNMNKDLGYINQWCQEREITGIILGLPLELSGEEEEACVQVRHFANKLIKKTSLPIFLQDERLSTAAVTRALQESDMTRKKRQSVDDKLAASYILQLVLDRLAYQKS